MAPARIEAVNLTLQVGISLVEAAKWHHEQSFNLRVATEYSSFSVLARVQVQTVKMVP